MAAPPAPARGSLPQALRGALAAGLLALGLAVPILALRTEQNMSNELVLQTRWSYVAFAVVATFVLRLAYLLAAPVATRRSGRGLPRIAALNENVQRGKFTHHLREQIVEFFTVGDAIHQGQITVADFGPVRAVHVAVIEVVALHAPGIEKDAPILGSGIG